MALTPGVFLLITRAFTYSLCFVYEKGHHQGLCIFRGNILVFAARFYYNNFYARKKDRLNSFELYEEKESRFPKIKKIK